MNYFRNKHTYGSRGIGVFYNKGFFHIHLGLTVISFCFHRKNTTPIDINEGESK